MSSYIVCLVISGDLAKMGFGKFGAHQDPCYSYVMEFAAHDSSLPFSKFWESARKVIARRQALFEWL